MSIAQVVTRGYGSFGSVSKLPTLGYSIGAPPVSYAFTLEAGRVFVPGTRYGRVSQPGTRYGRVSQPGMAVGTTRVPGAERVRVIK